jgi:putative SOS response-associated peptidase YedK
LVNRWKKNTSRASQCINAKGETVEVRPSFRDAFKKRRRVVPADGFCEWTGPKSARRPMWIHRADDKLILFAGGGVKAHHDSGDQREAGDCLSG